MQIGVTIPNIELSLDTAELRDFVQAAEDLGYDYLMNYDHVVGADLSVRPDWKPFFGNPPIYTIDDAFREPLIMYGYIAAVTKKIGFTTGVIILPQRQTVLLAKQTAEIDLLSGGRLRLGVGVGWNDVEFQSMGMNFRDRGKRSAEQIEVMRKLWTEESVTFEGQWHTLDAVGIRPLPVQRPIPVWIGGTADPVLKRIAKLGDGWYVPSYLNEEQIVEHTDRLMGYAEQFGRNRDSIGLEGIIRMWGREAADCAESLEMWDRIGATHVTFNTESDSYRNRLPGAQMESQGERADFQSMDDRIEALRQFKEASASFLV